MQEIGYDYWGLIPYDEDPLTGALLARNPPMMSIMALETQFSLVFKLKNCPPSVVIQIETTALSAEGLKENVLNLYTGDAEDAFRLVPDISWEKGYESMYALFKTTLDKPASHIKLNYSHANTLVINRVEFYG